MKRIIKKILKIFISDKFLKKFRYSIGLYGKNKKNITFVDKIKFVVFYVPRIKLVSLNSFSKITDFNKIIYSKYFSYYIDFNSIVDYEGIINNNITPDYSVILKYSLNDFKNMYKDNKEQLNFLNELELYLDKFILRIKKDSKDNDIVKYLENIKTKACVGFDEAIQRILFFNQIFWQMGYKLCGLGRLDYILDEYYKNSKISKEKAGEIIYDFYSVINSYFPYKSNCLSGDTGQIIIIGGVDEKGNNFSNDLTYIFIDQLGNFNKPDPKLLLRVTKDTNKDLIEKSIELMSTGIGSPLLSNDDVIIPKLVDFGYDIEDARNYVTAACWEPTPCGNTIDCNNIRTINFLIPFEKMLNDFDGNVDNITDKYKKYLSEYIKNELSNLSNVKYNDQPYLSLFIKDCRDSGNTINNCKIKNKNIGVTAAGLSSVVNSILNLQKLNNLGYDNLNEARLNNFKDNDILDALKHNNKTGYASSKEDAINLVNDLTLFISNEFDKYTTYYGGKFKFGLSAPSYVEAGRSNKASFDGRKDYEPLTVHISSDNNFLEIMDFASKINYPKNCINGNVVDFIITPGYLENNKDKFVDCMIAYINKGIYQLQTNVIDSKKLIAAKEDPSLFPNLIVRVWGFSSYFNDLPEEYKDLLIERAIKSEQG